MQLNDKTRWLMMASALPALTAAALLTGQPAAAANAPNQAVSQVSNGVKESALATVTLAESAIKRLGIETAPVEKRDIAAASMYGGEVIAAPGHAIAVTAPLAGIVAAPASGNVPVAGSRLNAGTAVLRLVPLPAAGDLAAASAQLDLRRAQLQRSEELLKSGGASQEEVEQARVDVARARIAANIATGRADATEALALTVGHAAILQSMHVSAGQVVPAGAPLYELAPTDQLWIRVSLYVGDADRVSGTTAARVARLSDWQGSTGVTAKAVDGPRTADAAMATTDLYYTLDAAAAGQFRPGERVRVSLEHKGRTSSLVVRESAIFRDVQGGAWVYVAADGGQFHRERVTIRRMQAGLAILERGPAAGTRVVSVGVAELAGAEFGVDH